MSVDVPSLLRSWPVLQPTRVERVGGTNNVTWRVATADGAYILRIYANAGASHHRAYEHALLLALSRLDLSFSVPAPLAGNTGETLIRAAIGEEETVAALFPVIPGRHPTGWDPRETEMAGAALGELDAALATVHIEHPAGVPTYGEIDRIRSLVPDPVQAIWGLRIPTEQRRDYVGLLASVRAGAPTLYACLPRQIIHSDLARSNILLDRGQVSGVLDFGFAAPDLRALDLAIAFRQFAADATAGGFRFLPEVTAALARGYRRWVALEPEEQAAIPVLLQLRSTVSVIHRLGRMRAGFATTDDVASRLREDLRMRAWLREHGEELV